MILLVENVLSQISVILSSRNPRLLSLASSLIWVMIYDCEKSKVVLRKTRLWSSIQSLDQEFASITPDGEEEEVYLQEAIDNTVVVKRLMSPSRF